MERNDTTRSLSLLVVDDDKELCAMMKEFFVGAGHRLESAHDGQAGLSTALKGSFDLLVLDVMLPKLDGYAVLKELRQRSELPVIMLTSRTQRRDRILGLDTGADDYLRSHLTQMNCSHGFARCFDVPEAKTRQFPRDW